MVKLISVAVARDPRPQPEVYYVVQHRVIVEDLGVAHLHELPSVPFHLTLSFWHEVLGLFSMGVVQDVEEMVV